MEVRLLGPVGLQTGEIGIGVGGPRAQAVLALLAVRPHEVVTADWLIDQLWSGHPPRAARVALQSYISRLRGLSAPETKRMLPRHRHGYFLDTSAARVDVARFIRLSELGCSQVSAGNWRDALENLRSARMLWQGVPFTGIDEVPALTAERRSLEEMHFETRFSELTAVLETRGPAEIIGSLRELVHNHVWDERGWRLLMLALYRSGRQTEALEAAARARRLLIEEQGLEPSRDLTDLEYRILNHHPSLLPGAPPSITLRDRLGIAPARLVGRSRELTELLAEWETSATRHQARLVLVRGEPGVGKSHLVTELSGRVGDRGGTLLVGRCLDEPQLALQPWFDLGADLGVPEAGHGPQLSSSHAVQDAPDLRAHRLFSAIPQRFREIVRAGATLLVAEDVHWAGVAALRLLDQVLTRCADLPLLVVATMRSTAADLLPPTRGALSELSSTVQPHTIQLDGLNPLDLQAMLADRGLPVSIGEATSIWLRTGGVPWLAVEARQGGHRVLDTRLAGVSRTAASTADLLAMAGEATPLRLLQLASGVDEETLAAALEELIAVGMVCATPGPAIAFEFCHPLYREALQARLSDLRRLLLSRRLLSASEAEDFPRCMNTASCLQEVPVIIGNIRNTGWAALSGSTPPLSDSPEG